MFVRKMLSLDQVDLKVDGDAGKFAGYASVFGGVDAYGDTIVQGAFASTLRNNGKPKMFYNHDWTMPVGRYSVAKEDDHGLYVEGELTPGHSLAQDVRAGMKHGTIDGLSIGGYVRKGDYDETDTGRVIRKWATLIEVSPVVFPADAAARIDGSSVKGVDVDELVADIESIRDFERLLRDAGGFSKRAATALAAKAKAILSQGEPDGAAQQIERELQERANRLALIRFG